MLTCNNCWLAINTKWQFLILQVFDHKSIEQTKILRCYMRHVIKNTTVNHMVAPKEGQGSPKSTNVCAKLVCWDISFWTNWQTDRHGHLFCESRLHGGGCSIYRLLKSTLFSRVHYSPSMQHTKEMKELLRKHKTTTFYKLKTMTVCVLSWIGSCIRDLKLDCICMVHILNNFPVKQLSICISCIITKKNSVL